MPDTALSCKRQISGNVTSPVHIDSQHARQAESVRLFLCR